MGRVIIIIGTTAWGEPWPLVETVTFGLRSGSRPLVNDT